MLNAPALGVLPAPGAAAPRRAVVVHSGARDAYQLALALEEAGLLERLVTDLYWPEDRLEDRLEGRPGNWARALPDGLRRQLRQRYAAHLPSSRVQSLAVRGAVTLLLDRAKHAPFRWRRALVRSTDAALGRAAGRLARQQQALLVAYSYYGYDAFRAYGAPGMLFQLHPHPLSMRRILREELRRHPECSASLLQEWELALPEKDFRRLVDEIPMAGQILAASSFTRQTLMEQGIAPQKISVVPYGVDCERFAPGVLNGDAAARTDGPLRLLFVGRINQRKGIQYLLEALRLLDDPAGVHLTVCGRVVDGLALFREFAGQVTVRPSVSLDELVAAYRAADLFVLPSVGEGFGQVLLEALACGLPVLSTTHTAAPDLIREGREGFVVEPGRAELLAQTIAWASTHRRELAQMRVAARERAQGFSWAAFRRSVAEIVREFSVRQDAAQDLKQNGQQAREALHV